MTSWPNDVHVGTLSRSFGSASLPASSSYQRPSSNPNCSTYPHPGATMEHISALERQHDGRQVHAGLLHVGRAASAPRERPLPDLGALSTRPRTPTEQGSDVRTFYVRSGELGSQLAAEYMREAAQTSGNAHMASVPYNGE